jgi:mannose-6-phosphate isomerase
VTPLTNPIKPYPWGSRTTIASLQRRPVPTAQPEAELWMGAHPAGPSLLADPAGPVPLTEAIARDAEATLGRSIVDRYGPRLPYLMKLLAATRPLSLQAHPEADVARAGYAAEAGRPLDDPERNYRDPYHKPELLVAIEPFEALCGFRPPEQSAELLAALGVRELDPVVDALGSGPSAGLRRAVERLMMWPPDRRADLVAAVARAGPGLADRLGSLYPDDVGVVVALLLNHVRLRPGEAVFMPPGTLHAYLSGFGVEVMAASDNVLRGGLTDKHVDVVELLRVLRYEVLPEPVVPGRALTPEVTGWPVPADEFALRRVVAAAGSPPVVVPGEGPRILACLHGPARLRTDGPVRELAAGESVFVTPDEPPVWVGAAGSDGPADAVVFQASVGSLVGNRTPAP